MFWIQSVDENRSFIRRISFSTFHDDAPVSPGFALRSCAICRMLGVGGWEKIVGNECAHHLWLRVEWNEWKFSRVPARDLRMCDVRTWTKRKQMSLVVDRRSTTIAWVFGFLAQIQSAERGKNKTNNYFNIVWPYIFTNRPLIVFHWMERCD